MINYLLSFFYPVRLRNYSSRFSGNIEINLVNGIRMIDTKTSNYSYGSLQKVLKTGLKGIQFGTNHCRVLVLGMGGGSVVQTIRRDFKSDAHITLVDIDEEMIAIARNEFKLLNYGNITLVNADAFSYMQNLRSAFDLIIMDVFIIDIIPEIFLTEPFLKSLNRNLTPNGSLIYNTMSSTLSEDVLISMSNFMTPVFDNVRILKSVNGTNNLLLASGRTTNHENL